MTLNIILIIIIMMKIALSKFDIFYFLFLLQNLVSNFLWYLSDRLTKQRTGMIFHFSQLNNPIIVSKSSTWNKQKKKWWVIHILKSVFITKIFFWEMLFVSWHFLKLNQISSFFLSPSIAMSFWESSLQLSLRFWILLDWLLAKARESTLSDNLTHNLGEKEKLNSCLSRWHFCKD